jgi:MFS family permease
MATADERLITPDFARITGSALAYFIAIGVIVPVLPVYVEVVLHGSGTTVGIVVGAFAVSAALLRTAVGRIGDQRGRRVLVLCGASIAGLSVLGYAVAENVPWLIAMRLLTGVGEAAMFVGAATAVQDLAPSARRGEATSYFSIAVYGGLAIGPLIGESVRTQWGIDAAWFTSAAFCVVAVLVAVQMPTARPSIEAQHLEAKRALFHPAAPPVCTRKRLPSQSRPFCFSHRAHPRCRGRKNRSERRSICPS